MRIEVIRYQVAPDTRTQEQSPQYARVPFRRFQHARARMTEPGIYHRERGVERQRLGIDAAARGKAQETEQSGPGKSDALCCAAPEGLSDFAAGLILLSLGDDLLAVGRGSEVGIALLCASK